MLVRLTCDCQKTLRRGDLMISYILGGLDQLHISPLHYLIFATREVVVSFEYFEANC